MQPDEVRELNRVGWDRRVEAQDIWTRPVSPGRIRRARAGEWSVVLTLTSRRHGSGLATSPARTYFA